VKHLKKMCAAGLVSLLALTVGVAPASASWLSMGKAHSKARSAARHIWVGMDESNDYDVLGCYRVSSSTVKCQLWFGFDDDVECELPATIRASYYGSAYVSRFGKSHCY
jgi:hypothetical protein